VGNAACDRGPERRNEGGTPPRHHRYQTESQETLMETERRTGRSAQNFAAGPPAGAGARGGPVAHVKQGSRLVPPHCFGRSRRPAVMCNLRENSDRSSSMCRRGKVGRGSLAFKKRGGVVFGRTFTWRGGARAGVGGGSRNRTRATHNQACGPEREEGQAL